MDVEQTPKKLALSGCPEAPGGCQICGRYGRKTCVGDRLLRMQKHLDDLGAQTRVEQDLAARAKLRTEISDLKRSMERITSNYRAYHRKDQTNTSICGDCKNVWCDWLQFGRPVAGWTATPSELYEDGWAVHNCPERL